MKNIVELFYEWRSGALEYKWPPITFGGDMDVNGVILDIDAYVTEKVEEGELGMGFIKTHLDAIRTHLKEQDATIKRWKDQSKMIDTVDWISLIKAERIRQDEKWGEQNHPPLKWIAILGEEYGEVCKAILEHDPKVIEEIIQTASVCIAWLECIKRGESDDR